MSTCKSEIKLGYKALEISEENYWKVYFSIYINWGKNVARAKANNISVADIIVQDYKISYTVAKDIANNIALNKVA